MDPHNRGIISHMDSMNSVQDDLSKLNSSVLKSIHSVDNNSGTFHFITYSQEYIDSSYLNTDLLNNQLQNGSLHVDFIPQSNLLDHNQSIQAYTTDDLQNLVVDTSQNAVENDRKLFLQLVHKPQGNEAPVIMTNQFETNSMSVPSSTASVTMNNSVNQQHLPALHHEPNGGGHIRLYNPHSLANSTDTSQNLLPLPPLTPINRNLSPKRFSQQEPSTSSIKDEMDFETRRTDDEDLFFDDVEKSLPHKKRLSKKLGDQRKGDNEISVISTNNRCPSFAFSCQLCGFGMDDQLDFFNHLKSHYEISEQPEVVLPVVTTVVENACKKRPKLPRVKHTKKMKHTHHSEIELGHILVHDNSVEFSEPEDMLEGIRTVVQETVDADSDDHTNDNHHIEKNWYNDSNFNSSELTNQEIHISTDTDNYVVYMNKNEFEQQQILAAAEPRRMINHDERQHNEDEQIIPIITFDEHNQMQDIDKLVQYNLHSGGAIVQNPVHQGDLNMELILKDEVKEIDYCDDDANDQNYLLEQCDEEDENDYTEEEIESEGEKKDPEILKKPKVTHIVEETLSLDGEKKTKKYKCTITNCNRTFNSKTAIRYHELRHTGNRPHLCNTCGKSFLTSSALKVHGRLHSGEKPYKCNECDRTFRQWGDMKYHMTSIHSSEKSHQCEFCGKEFARRYSLIVHRRIHTGEKNYVCEYCQKSFRASSYLQNHRRIHTGEKPHQCPYCTKKFRCRGDMKRHLSTHNREKGKNIAFVNVIAESPPPEDSSSRPLKSDIIDLTTIKPKTEVYDLL